MMIIIIFVGFWCSVAVTLSGWWT